MREPEHIRHVLQDRQGNYDKQTQSYHRMRVAFGDGLVTSEGSAWLLQRRMAQPGFHRKVVEGYAGRMVREACGMVDRLRLHAAAGSAVNIAEELARTTFAILCWALLGTAPEPLFQPVRDFCTLLAERVNAAVALPRWLPTPGNRRLRRLTSELHEQAYRLIARARASSEPRDDFLSMLAHARDPDTGVAMTDHEVLDEVMTLFVAGHETSSATLSWTFHLLACHPEVDSRLRAELDTVVGNRLPEASDVAKLVYARMVLEEAMRLYPPAWSLSRRAVEEDIIGGYRIPRSAVVLVSQWVTHRLPGLWERPDDFVPERFAPAQVAARPRFSYFPFLGGPRQCIGVSFASLEALLILATVVPRIRYRPFPLIEVQPAASMVLRPHVGPYLLVKDA